MYSFLSTLCLSISRLSFSKFGVRIASTSLQGCLASETRLACNSLLSEGCCIIISRLYYAILMAVRVQGDIVPSFDQLVIVAVYKNAVQVALILSEAADRVHQVN